MDVLENSEWLKASDGSMRHRKDSVLDLQVSGEPVYALGVHFTYDLEVSEKKIVLIN